MVNDVGTNLEGVYYLVVYGHAYCRVQALEEKMKVLESFRTTVSTLSEKYFPYVILIAIIIF